MDVFEKLERKFDELLRRIHDLEAEKGRLEQELVRERNARQDVLDRVDRLLAKIQDVKND